MEVKHLTEENQMIKSIGNGDKSLKLELEKINNTLNEKNKQLESMR